MLRTITSCLSRTVVTKGRKRQSRASMVGGVNENGLPRGTSASMTTTSFRPPSAAMVNSSSSRQPVPVEMRPQYTGSGNVTRVNPFGIGFPPVIVTLPVIVPPLVTAISS